MLSIFGGFQPDKIKQYVQGAQGGCSSNDGLIQRFQLLVWPDLPDFTGQVDRAPNKAAVQNLELAIIQLNQISDNGIEGASRDRSGLLTLHFDEEAQNVFNEWLNKNERMIRSAKLDPAEQGHFSKFRSLVPALALLNHLIDGQAGPVGADSLWKALHLAWYLRSHAKRLYASVHGLDQGPLRTLANQLLDNKLVDGFTARTVEHKCWRGLKQRAVIEKALDTLVELDWLQESQSTRSVKGGRPTVTYRINPAISKELL